MIIGVTHDQDSRVVQRLSVSTKVSIGLPPNGNRNYPTKLDHFVFLRKKKSANRVEWGADPELTQHYGEQCRELHIMLIDDDIENVFPSSYGWWTATERKCWGDGVTATRRTAEKPALTDLDRELERRGLRFARYADDSNVYVRSRRAGERVMGSITRFITTKLKLKVNEQKSAVARPWERKFLGFSFTWHREPKRRIAPKAVLRFKAKVRERTRRTRGVSTERMTQELARYLKGWIGYFGKCQTPSVLKDLEKWSRRRLRSAIWKQWKRSRVRYAELRKRGVGKDLAAQTVGSAHGPWRLADSPALHFALPNAYFDALGLPSLTVAR